MTARPQDLSLQTFHTYPEIPLPILYVRFDIVLPDTQPLADLPVAASLIEEEPDAALLLFLQSLNALP